MTGVTDKVPADPSSPLPGSFNPSDLPAIQQCEGGAPGQRGTWALLACGSCCLAPWCSPSPFPFSNQGSPLQPLAAFVSLGYLSCDTWARLCCYRPLHKTLKQNRFLTSREHHRGLWLKPGFKALNSPYRLKCSHTWKVNALNHHCCEGLEWFQWANPPQHCSPQKAAPWRWEILCISLECG